MECLHNPLDEVSNDSRITSRSEELAFYVAKMGNLTITTTLLLIISKNLGGGEFYSSGHIIKFNILHKFLSSVFDLCCRSKSFLFQSPYF